MGIPTYGSDRDDVNIAPQGGSSHRRSQRLGQKKSFSQRPRFMRVSQIVLWHSAVVNITSRERNRLRQVDIYPRNTMEDRPIDTLISGLSQPGLTMAAPTVGRQGIVISAKGQENER